MRVALGLASGQSLDKLLDQGEMWITFDAFLRCAVTAMHVCLDGCLGLTRRCDESKIKMPRSTSQHQSQYMQGRY
jgi:hypothetical protein